MSNQQLETSIDQMISLDENLKPNSHNYQTTLKSIINYIEDLHKTQGPLPVLFLKDSGPSDLEVLEAEPEDYQYDSRHVLEHYKKLRGLHGEKKRVVFSEPDMPYGFSRIGHFTGNFRTDDNEYVMFLWFIKN